MITKESHTIPVPTVKQLSKVEVGVAASNVTRSTHPHSIALELLGSETHFVNLVARCTELVAVQLWN